MTILTTAVRLHIDAPTDWASLPRGIIVRGWCFAPGGSRPRGIRLTINGASFPGQIGLPRPDVAAAIAEAPGPDTGFEIRGCAAAGPADFRIELLTAEGGWMTLAKARGQVRGSLLPKWAGGSAPAELMAFQLPGHAQHPPRILRAERFPRAPETPRPPLAIVTPSFNQGRFLPETVRGVLEQSGVSVQYVVQDGGSHDESRTLLSRLAARLHAWESGPDNGQADAIAKAFAKTSGQPEDIMAWINSDDFYLPGALAFVADYFARHPEVDAIYGHRILVDENSQEVGRWFLPKHDDEILRLNDFVPQETLFWRRRLWDKVGGLDPSLQFAMDWDLLLRFSAAGARIVRVPYFLACFRLHPAQKTSAAMHHTGQKEIDRLRTRTHGREISPAELESDPRLLRYLRRSAFIEWLWSLGIRAP